MKNYFVIMMVLFLFILTACSGNEGDNKQDHVWKSQTDTLNQAKEVQALANKATEAQRKAMEEISKP